MEAVKAYNHPTGEMFILLMVQALYMGNQQEPHLLCPIQMRSYRIVVDEVLKQLSVNCASMHSIYIPSMDLQTPLDVEGIISYINIFYPNELDVEHLYPHQFGLCDSVGAACRDICGTGSYYSK